MQESSNYYPKIKEIKTIYKSSLRILNLTTTVASIALDYAYVLNSKSTGKKTEYETLIEELAHHQHDQEITTLELRKAIDTEEINAIENRIKQTRMLINATSERMANCKEETYLTDLHKRSATKLRLMCEENRGLYIKLGQHISMLDHIIPAPYQEELSKLLDKNPHSSWESVRRIILEDLGDHPENLFLYVDEQPIASASLAQVHISLIFSSPGGFEL